MSTEQPRDPKLPRRPDDDVAEPAPETPPAEPATEDLVTGSPPVDPTPPA